MTTRPIAFIFQDSVEDELGEGSWQCVVGAKVSLQGSWQFIEGAKVNPFRVASSVLLDSKDKQ